MMKKSFDPQQFRQQFPAIRHDQIYFDSAATALKPLVMIEATNDYYHSNGATVHRGNYHSAQKVTESYEQSRQRVAEWINSKSSQQVIWTKGTTEAINLVAQGFFQPRLTKGDEIIVCQSEHHSNLIPWLMLAKKNNLKIIPLPLNNDFVPDIEQLPALLTPRTKLLAIGQMSNVTGGCPDLPQAIRYAHQNQTLVMVDGAQGAVHSPIDVQKLDVDFYAFSAHKLYGPTGVGALYVKADLLAEMSPWQGGGKMLQKASFTEFTAQPAPNCFEAGTPNIAGVLGFNATLNWLNGINMTAAEQYACSLANYAEQQLALLPGFISYRADNSSLLSFNIENYHYADIATLLAEQNIAIRSGQHCAQPLLAEMGVEGTLRASFAPYNQLDEVDHFCNALKQALSILTN